MNNEKKNEKATETKQEKRPESLDALVQVLTTDDLRHVIGGGRSALPHFRADN
jgi:hypothetical protein